MKATVRSRPRTMIAWWPPEWPLVRRTWTPGMISSSPSAEPGRAHGSDDAQLGLLVGGHQARVRARARTSTRPTWATMRARGNAGPPSAVSRPPAWSKWRWQRAMRSIDAGSKPAARSDGRMGWPRTPRWRADGSSMRSPMPVSTRTRPAGVSTSRQLSAWVRRVVSAFSSSSTRCSHMTRGTGPRMVPASLVKMPAWTRAMVVPPPRSARQSALGVDGHLSQAARAALGAAAVGLEVAEGTGRRRRRLALVPRAETLASRRAARPGSDIAKNEIWPMRMPK